MRWAIVADRVGALPIPTRLALIAAFAIVLGLLADLFQGSLHGPLERARALSTQGSHAEAERIYLDLAEREPAGVALLLELLDNHEHLAPLAGTAAASLPETDTRLAVVLAQAPPDAALLASYWRHVLRDAATAEERARVVAAADREPPMPWANDVLGRELLRAGDARAAAKRFAREAVELPGRDGDAKRACDLWAGLQAWSSLDAALADARFDRQLGPGDRLTPVLA